MIDSKKISKQQKLEYIKTTVYDFSISAYNIASNTNLTEAGIARILKGIAKNPHESSLNEIISYIHTYNGPEDVNEKHIVDILNPYYTPPISIETEIKNQKQKIIELKKKIEECEKYIKSLLTYQKNMIELELNIIEQNTIYKNVDPENLP
ncbi:hypothetical protein EKM01_09440 [Flavobacterium sp. RSP46]|uniref:hypothetical protein n=1 Tax=Flavobacterium sp. RSP46 TaxID=2497486 RepID=UPI000F88CE3A|nr:hypothetical protein [Flavobacterium sp. RSP46]RTY90657.1 hypothetical protein EKM01_09440 [Flavobacterium sp. RSP46]